MRSRILACAAVLAAISITVVLMYKHTTNQLHAQQFFDSGRRLLQITRYEQAILSFSQAIDLKSDFAEAYFLRGTALVAMGDERVNTDHAIADFTKVMALRPGDPKPLLERCATYLGQQNF